MFVSFSIVSFSLALCGRRPRTRGLFSPSSKRTLHQPFLTSPHQLECEAAFFHTQSQRKRRKGLYIQCGFWFWIFFTIISVNFEEGRVQTTQKISLQFFYDHFLQLDKLFTSGGRNAIGAIMLK